MISNKESYRHEYIESKHGLFDNYIDCAYILTMENSTRRESYMDQLRKYNPHSKVIIQHNLGFKKCKKQLYEQNTVHDLNDAYYHVFLHARENDYTNILIFEDDFFFDKITEKDINEIGMFINNNNFHIYNLGPIVNIGINETLYHKRNIIMSSTHGVIYNKLYFDYYIEHYNKQNSNLSCDELWIDTYLKKYSYYKPICFQLVTETDNSKNWSLYLLCKYLIKITKLDKNHKAYYSITYLCTFIGYVLILSMLYLCSL